MKPLMHAITELEIALDVRVTNEPINRARGDLAQADLEKDSATEFRRALKILKGIVDWHSQSDEGLRLRCGELTAQEIRTIRAVLNAILP